MDNKTFSLSGTQSPSRNPFENGHLLDQASFGKTFLQDIDRPSVAVCNEDEDFFARESLGILPSTTLFRDSLTSDFITSVKDPAMVSPRESLGILNISSMDLVRESIGIFNINSPLFKREFDDYGKKDNLASNDFQNVMFSPNTMPQILLSNSENRISSSTFADFDRGFLFPNSKKISGVSSESSGISANPSFNSRSLEEPSKIHSVSPVQKDRMTPTDPLNQAFLISSSNNCQSVSSKFESTQYFFASDLENIRNRIQSLPPTFENHVLGDIAIENKTENASFVEELIIYRGVEDEKDLEDSVFLQDKKRINEDTSFNFEERSFDGERYLLDSTPQPDWEWCSSHSSAEDKEKSPTVSKEIIFKKVEEMLGMQPVKVEEKLNLKNTSKCDSASSINLSQNVSRISRASQCSIPEHQSCTSNNFSQDLSKISHTSKENVSRLIKNLSDIINDKEDLSRSQRTEGHHVLNFLGDLLGVNSSKISNSEDFGHSSVEYPHLDENRDKIERVSTEKNAEVLDLSCKNKPCCSNNSKVNESLPSSKSAAIRNPPPYIIHSPNHAILENVSNDSAGPHPSLTTNTGNNSVRENSNSSNSSAKNHSNSSVASLRRHSSITHDKVTLGADKFKRGKVGTVSSKKEPLRAILPVENMAKGTRNMSKSAHVAITPERISEGNKLTFKSKKTSTPLQEPKMKPMAASTPANRQSQDSKASVIPAAEKPKFTRSFSYQPRTLTTVEQATNNRTSGGNIPKNIGRHSVSKVESTRFVRRNSVTEGVSDHQKITDGIGSPRLRRSFSTGKDSKILCALSRVRQNILNSPYYNPRKNMDSVNTKKDGTILENDARQGSDLKNCSLELKSLSKMSQSKKLGKENLKP